MKKQEIVTQTETFKKSEIIENTLVVYGDEKTVTVDVVMAHIADYEDVAKWQTFEAYVSLQGKDDYTLLCRDDGSETEECNIDDMLDGITSDNIRHALPEGHNWDLYEELPDRV